MNPTWTSDDGRVRLFNADNRDVIASLSGIDAIITSPPYNLGNTTGGGLGNKGRHGKWQAAQAPDGLGNGYGDFKDHLPHEEYVAWQHEFLRACWGVLSDGGAIFYNHKQRIFNGRVVTPLDYVPEGLPIRQVIIWARAGGINFSPTHYMPTHEWIVLITKDGFRLKNQGASGVGDVWYIPQEPSKEHPAPFPNELPAKALETITADVVCDPFMGRGTVGEEAVKAGRQFIGIERHTPFFELAKRRIQDAMGMETKRNGVTQKRMFGQDINGVIQP